MLGNVAKLGAGLACAAAVVWALRGERAAHFENGKGGEGTAFSEDPHVTSFAEWKKRDPMVYRQVIQGFIVAFCVFVLVLNRVPGPGELLGTMALCLVVSQRMHTYYAYHVDAYAEDMFRARQQNKT